MRNRPEPEALMSWRELGPVILSYRSTGGPMSRPRGAVGWLAPLLLVLVLVSTAPAAAAITVTVPGHPLWTDTGITVTSGTSVVITASGTWGFIGALCCGPDGDPHWADLSDQFFLGANKGALIAYIGADPTQGHLVAGNTFFPQATGYIAVGSFSAFVAPTGGRLWLGINDDGHSLNADDNQGFVTAEIAVGRAPGDSLTLAVFANPDAVRAGQTLTVTVGLNDASVATPVDFYLGALLPDGETLAFLTEDGHVALGRVSDRTSFVPVARAVSLRTPFSTIVPGVVSYQWQGSEPSGSYTVFAAALQSGTQNVLDIATASFVAARP
jgi:hypothetical protein